MKPDDLKFVRKLKKSLRIPLRTFHAFGDEEVIRLLTLLIESEAMREKAEHGHFGLACEWCNRSLADWIAAKRKEIEGG